MASRAFGQDFGDNLPSSQAQIIFLFFSDLNALFEVGGMAEYRQPAR